MKNIFLFLMIFINLTACVDKNIINKNHVTHLTYTKVPQSTELSTQLLKQLQFNDYGDESLSFQHKKVKYIFEFNSKSKIDEDLVVVIGHKYFSKLSYYSINPKNKLSKASVQYRIKPTKNRIFNSEKFVFNLKGESFNTHLLVVESHVDSPISIQLFKKDDYLPINNKLTIFFSILYTSMFALFLVYFIYYFYAKNISYLYFSLYILLGLIAIYWQEGRTNDYAYFYFPFLGEYTKTFYIILANIMAYVFLYHFLDLKKQKHVLTKILVYWNYYLSFLLLSIIVLALINYDTFFITNIYNLTVQFGSILVLILAYTHFKRGNRQAGFLLTSWVVFVIFASLRLYYVTHLAPNHFFLQHSYEFGLLFQAFILALGLADQEFGYKKSRDKAQENYSQVNKALFSETLINNFLYKIKEDILNEEKLEKFSNVVENTFENMLMKFAPIEVIIKLKLKESSHQLISSQIDSNDKLIKNYFNNNQEEIIENSLNGSVYSSLFNENKNQFINIPINSHFIHDNCLAESLIFQIKSSHQLNADDILQLKAFIEKSQKALHDSLELTQITNHAKKIITLADEKEKSMKLKDQFFANVSHEFRTPLTLTIAPLVDLHKQREFLNTSGKYLVDTALSNAQDLLRLVDNILDIQKLQSDSYPIHVSKINLNQLIYNEIKKLRNWVLDHNQVLSFNKTLDDDVFIYCDFNEVKKIISNLISNAIKYSGDNKHISLAIELDDIWVKILIQDDGNGINEATQAHIFDRFYQGTSIHHITELGSGIGLSFVKDIMHLHSGKVTLKSAIGKGTLFTLWFKKGKSHFDNNQINKPQGINQKLGKQEIKSVRVNNVPIKKHNNGDDDVTTVLIVEDNPELRRFLIFKFQPYYHIVEAENGYKGFENAKSSLPDLIISDVVMPVLDGTGMLKLLREHKDTQIIPVILLTANSGNNNAVAGLGLGADDYVTKPFDFDELKARVDRLILSRKEIKHNFQFKQADNKKSKSSFEIKLEEIIYQEISNHEFNVDKLAQALFLERSSLYKKIKKEFDITPIAYIREFRLKIAKKLIIEKKISVSEAAYACGFQSLSYFSKQFKKTYGKSPSDVL